MEQNIGKIKNLGIFSRTLGFLELRALPNILGKNEIIERIAQGVNKKSICVLVATDKRIIFINKSFPWGLNVEDYLYADIDSIEYYVGPIFGSIHFATIGHMQSFVNKILRKQIEPFVSFVRKKTNQAKKQNNGNKSIINDLERLAKLKEQGALTNEEFNRQKSMLLGSG